MHKFNMYIDIVIMNIIVLYLYLVQQHPSFARLSGSAVEANQRPASHLKNASLAVSGLSVKTTVSSLRTSSCKLDSSRSTGRTWVSRTPTQLTCIEWDEFRGRFSPSPLACSLRSHVRVLRQQDVHPVSELLLVCRQRRHTQDSYPLDVSTV